MLVHVYATSPGKAKWSGPHQWRWEENEFKFHSVTCYITSIVSRVYVYTTKLLNITCTLVAIGVILWSLEYTIFTRLFILTISNFLNKISTATSALNNNYWVLDSWVLSPLQYGVQWHTFYYDAYLSMRSACNTMSTKGTLEWHPRLVALLVRGPKLF